MDINASLLGQAITFAILVWFTMKFVWPPLTTMLDERAKRIADGLAAADRGKQDLQNAEKLAADKVREAKKQASEIIAQARVCLNSASLLYKSASSPSTRNRSQLLSPNRFTRRVRSQS